MIGRATQLSLWLLVGVLHAGVAVAQAPRAQPAFPSFHASLTGTTSVLQPRTRLYARSDSSAAASQRTYWLEGGVIGAGVLGVTSFFVYKAVASSLCTGSDAGGCNDYRTLATVGGVAVGFLVGALIGRGHPKAEPGARE